MVKLLDLFCGAGGAGKGYQDAGFEITGVDIVPQPNYPGRFIQADALEFLARHGHEYDGVHASPPCQSYSTGVTSRSSRYSPTLGKDEPALIAPVHEMLTALGKPWVIENVYGARAHMPVPPTLLCGSHFGLLIPRHRLFATSFDLPSPGDHDCRGLAKRSAAELGWDYRDMSVTGKGRRAGTSARWRLLMGIDWHMTQHEIAESIPPAYTRYVGRHLLREYA
jgi:DNA (cytosine-5)-methyltransferase 1